MRMFDEFRSVILDRTLAQKMGIDKPGVQWDDPIAIDITEPVRFFYEGNDQEDWDFREDFHCTTSPFEAAWYECIAPPTSNSHGVIGPGPGTFARRLGWLVLSLHLKPGMESRMPAVNPLMTLAKAAINDGGGSVRSYNDSSKLDFGGTAPSFMQATICSFVSKAGQFRSVATLFDYLDNVGLPILGTRQMLITSPELNRLAHNGDAKEVDEVRDFVLGFAMPISFSLGFLHCKNVQLVDIPIPEKVARNRIAKGQHPGTVFKELRIDPMRKILRHEGKSAEVGLRRALHICRGHLATYTEDRPLFGRSTGTFWIPAHVRGDIEAGEVRKNYKVMAPKGQA